MTSWRRLIPWLRVPDTSQEVRCELERLHADDVEVRRLGAELREMQRSNHFSEMVRHAIKRSAEGDAP